MMPSPITNKKRSTRTEYSRTRIEWECNHSLKRRKCPPAAPCGGASGSSRSFITCSIGVSRIDEPTGRGLDHGLGSCGHVEFTAGVFDMEIHRPLAQPHNRGDFRRCLSTSRPSQAFQLPIVQRYVARPHLITHPLSQACVDDRSKNLKIDRLGNVVVGAPPPTFQFAVAI